MFINLLVFALSFLIAFGVWFLFQPYFVWRKTQKKDRKEIIYVITKDNKINIKSYLNSFKSQDPAFEYSIVVPAYNEQERIPSMLKDTIAYFNKKGKSYEIIVVNDASKDKTSAVVLSTLEKNPNVDIKVVEYPLNKGKGGAVRTGMLVARGKYILMADADGATEITDFDKVYNQLAKLERNGLGISAGSRNHLMKDVKRERSPIRSLLGHTFNFVVQTICGVKLKDTQCGFKLFTHKSAKLIFEPLHLERWAFDVELFIIANQYGMPYDEIPVNWRDVEGSKLNVVSASITMARDFVLVRILYLLGLWSTKDAYVLPDPPQNDEGRVGVKRD